MSTRHPKREDPGRGLTRQVGGVALLLVGVKLLATLKEILLARSYGVGPLMDAYQFVMQLAGWAPSIFLAICSATLLPTYAALRSDPARQFPLFRAQVHGATLLLGGLLMLAWIALCLGTPLLGAWSGLPVAARAYAAEMAAPLGLMIAGGIYIALLTTEAISARLYGGTFLDGIQPLVLATALLLAASSDAALLVSATVGGVVAHVVLLAAYVRRRSGLPRPTLRLNHPQWRTLLAALGALMLAQLMQAAASIVDQFWAARSGDGSLSVMAYANRILFVVVGIGSLAISRTILPILADLTVQHRTQARQAARRWAARLFALSALGLALLWPASPWVVAILFERGAFGSDETQRVATFLKYSWLQLPSSLASLVLIQQVLAESRYRMIAVFAGFNLVLKLGANALLVPHFGVDGLALATSAMHLFMLAMLVFWWHKSRHDD